MAWRRDDTMQSSQVNNFMIIQAVAKHMFAFWMSIPEKPWIQFPRFSYLYVEECKLEFDTHH